MSLYVSILSRRERASVFAPKRQQDSARGFNPGFGISKEGALEALRTPRPQGAIPTMRNTPVLQNSMTPLARIRGRGRRRGRERNASRVAPDRRRLAKMLRQYRSRSFSGATFRAHLVGTPDPGLKPWAEPCCPSGADQLSLCSATQASLDYSELLLL